MDCTNWTSAQISSKMEEVKRSIVDAKADETLDRKERYDLLVDLRTDLHDLQSELDYRAESRKVNVCSDCGTDIVFGDPEYPDGQCDCDPF